MKRYWLLFIAASVMRASLLDPGDHVNYDIQVPAVPPLQRVIDLVEDSENRNPQYLLYGSGNLVGYFSPINPAEQVIWSPLAQIVERKEEPYVAPQQLWIPPFWLVTPPGLPNPPGGGTTNPPGGGTTNPPGGGITDPPSGGATNPPGGGIVPPPGNLIEPPSAPAPTPEPSTFLLIGCGLAGLGWVRRRR